MEGCYNFARQDRQKKPVTTEKRMEDVMRRILLKLSGEALAGDKKHGFDEETVRKVAAQIADVV